jgi:hypothetical protein
MHRARVLPPDRVGPRRERSSQPPITIQVDGVDRAPLDIDEMGDAGRRKE